MGYLSFLGLVLVLIAPPIWAAPQGAAKKKIPVAKTASKKNAPSASMTSKKISANARRAAAGMTARSTKKSMQGSLPQRKPAQAAPEAVPARPTDRRATAAMTSKSLESSLRGLQMNTGREQSASGSRMVRGAGGTHEIGEALRVTGQSRSLSMGLLFSKDGDQIEFGSPRTHYRDKVSSKNANY